MYAVMLMLLAAAPSLNAIDDANFALTSCGFAAFREADAQDQSLDQFKRTLASRCDDKMARMRELSVQLDVSSRGMSRSAAERTADDMLDNFRAQFADQYSNRDKTKAQLKALERALQQEGKSDAP